MTDWPEVVRAHGPLVWRTAYRLLNHDADAADCFQRTFLAAVELVEPVRHWPAVLVRLATARSNNFARYGPWPGRSAGRRPARPGDRPARRRRSRRLANGSGPPSRNRPAAGRGVLPVCLDGWEHGGRRQLGITANHVGVLLNRAERTCGTN